MKTVKSALPARYHWFRETGARPEWARALARAEVWREVEEAKGRLRVRWEYDPEPYEMGDAEDRPPSEVLGCVVEWRADIGDADQPDQDSRRRGLDFVWGDAPWTDRTSLWGIGDPDTLYRRLAEAELAHELFVGLAERAERTAWQAGAPD